MFQIEAVQKVETHILCSVTFSQQSCRLWDNVEKYGRAGQATWRIVLWNLFAVNTEANEHCWLLDTKLTPHVNALTW